MNVKYLLYTVLITSVITIVSTIYFKMKIEIDELKKENSLLTIQNIEYSNSIVNLKDAIEISNKSLEQIQIDNDRLTIEFNNWKNKSNDKKYKNEIVKEIMINRKDNNYDCNYGLEIINKIKKVKYDEL